MGRTNPRFEGDYIAQSIAEVNGFNQKLLELINKKAKGEEVTFTSKHYYIEWDTFNIVPVRIYADEKLSSANPKVYVSDLDDLMIAVNKCLHNYTVLVNKSEKDIRQALHDYAPTLENNEVYKFPFYLESKFCFDFKEYYLKKRKLVDYEIEDNENIRESGQEFYDDRDKVFNILREYIEEVSDENLAKLSESIIHYKHGNQIPDKYPVMALLITQSSLAKMIKKIRRDLNLDRSSGEYLANLFSEIPRKYVKGKPEYYNKEVLRKHI